MKKFKINWSETLYYEVNIEANSGDEAEEKMQEMDMRDYVYDVQSGDINTKEIPSDLT